MYRIGAPILDTCFERENRDLPTKEIVDAVAAATDYSPVELPPLYEYVDPDAVENLLTHQNESVDRDAILGFKVKELQVYIHSDGRIRVCDQTKPVDPQPVFDGHTV